jgi:hypothetical protein
MYRVPTGAANSETGFTSLLLKMAVKVSPPDGFIMYCSFAHTLKDVTY